MLIVLTCCVPIFTHDNPIKEDCPSYSYSKNATAYQLLVQQRIRGTNLKLSKETHLSPVLCDFVIGIFWSTSAGTIMV